MTERKDFEDWKTHNIFMQQEGRCANCGGSLKFGMGTGKLGKLTEQVEGEPNVEKHHKDGDSNNNKIENEELLCSGCHRSSLALSDEDYAKRYGKFRKLRGEVIDKLIDLFDKAVAKEVPSASIERLESVLNTALTLNSKHNDMNKGIFYPPPSVKALIDQRRIQNQTKDIIEGFKMGVQSVREIVKKDEK